MGRVVLPRATLHNGITHERRLMSKVGLLVECGRDGLEVHVCRRICELLVDASGKPPVPDIVPMDNKQILLQECGTVARRLLDDGCDRVVILWDERPAWPK